MDQAEAIKAAFKRLYTRLDLPWDETKDFLMLGVVSMLVPIGTSEADLKNHRFKTPGRRRTREELDRLKRHLTKLADHIESLHAPATLLLAELGMWDIGTAVKQSLREMARKCASVDLSQVLESAPPGKPRDDRAYIALGILDWWYIKMTGRKPARNIDPYTETAGGPYADLVSEVFKAINIDANTDHLTRMAIKRRKK